MICCPSRAHGGARHLESDDPPANRSSTLTAAAAIPPTSSPYYQQAPASRYGLRDRMSRQAQIHATHRKERETRRPARAARCKTAGNRCAGRWCETNASRVARRGRRRRRSATGCVATTAARLPRPAPPGRRACRLPPPASPRTSYSRCRARPDRTSARVPRASAPRSRAAP